MENYVYINVNFQEAYKRLDSLCKDCYSSVEGVSEYIRQLEYEQWRLQKFAVLWEEDYKMLKHVRWIRNKLSHEVGSLHSDICTQNDLDFVTNFHNKILNRTDPLAQLRKAEITERKRNITEKYTPTANYTEQHTRYTEKKQTSIFSVFWEKLKKLFY